jgi:GNAT superfamily N-acetyltransferase
MGHQHDDSASGLRPQCEADERAMRDVFVAVRRGVLDSAGLDENTVERLMQHRFELQRAGYRLAHPQATSEAIVHDGDVVGRLITDDGDQRVLLVDIMIDPDYQGRGIGSRVLWDLVNRAGSRPVEIRIDHGSPVEPWCRRHGFEQVAADDVQAHFVRVPRDLALAPTAV